MDLTTITVAQFKSRFYRDFYFANQNPNQNQPVPPEGVEIIQDIDIENAYADAKPLLNQGLFSCNDAVITTAYLYLAAHALCLNIKAADGNVNSSGSAGMPVNSRSVGSISESYTIPAQYADSALVAQYAQTAYGQKYLSLVLPRLVGNVTAVWGGAQPGL